MDPRFSSAVFLILSCWLWNAECRTYNQILKVINGGGFGKWGDLEMCNKGFANGFLLKFQPYQGWFSDDSSLTGIRLYCQHGTTIESTVSEIGDWGNLFKCTTGNLINFSLQVAKYGKRTDETSANNIKFTCQNRKVLETISPTDWGKYGPWSQSCNDGAICGMRTRVEAYRNSYRFDNTGLNNVILYCCK
ncbi:vitelline membrane outer layer protein 1-like [Erythrolamprus reginae]|uniref:vitelline membrane outer layer protein 1-like n=1 Tax=Erythrolamprus reginae TaxID=121349 RepID=UPI00396CC6FE